MLGSVYDKELRHASRVGTIWKFQHRDVKIMTNFNWYFTREEIENKSPSREDGVTLPTEIRYRREGARLIINASNTLGLYPPPSYPLSSHATIICFHMCELVSLTVEQSLRHDSDRSGVLPQVLHAAEFPTVQQVGGGRSLSSPVREGGGDSQEMSGHH